jgi:hypothetical protein
MTANADAVVVPRVTINVTVTGSEKMDGRIAAAPAATWAPHMSMSWLGLIADSDLVCRDAIALQTADSHVHVDVAMYRLEIFWPPVACVDDLPPA